MLGACEGSLVETPRALPFKTPHASLYVTLQLKSLFIEKKGHDALYPQMGDYPSAHQVQNGQLLCGVFPHGASRRNSEKNSDPRSHAGVEDLTGETLSEGPGHKRSWNVPCYPYKALKLLNTVGHLKSGCPF